MFDSGAGGRICTYVALRRLFYREVRLSTPSLQPLSASWRIGINNFSINLGLLEVFLDSNPIGFAGGVA